jgi:UDP-N-acetylglucosamine 2-epimerase (non-hydrolysing)
MQRLEPVLLAARPDMVLVVGDVNSTLAAALVAAKLGIPIAHVEAGLRSFDRSMPEEINRVVTDALSTCLLTTEQAAGENLRREGHADDRIHFVGNVTIDTLLACRQAAGRSPILRQLGLLNGSAPHAYGVVTLHRAGNVDDPDRLRALLRALRLIAADLPLVFPMHPRTAARSRALGDDGDAGRLRILPALGYLDFVQLMTHARVVITDSGGVQEETAVLEVPCLTLRDNTERPVTVECGWNRVVGSSGAGLLKACRQLLDGPPLRGRRPPLWDGHASQRILSVLLAERPWEEGRRTRRGGRRRSGAAPASTAVGGSRAASGPCTPPQAEE